MSVIFITIVGLILSRAPVVYGPCPLMRLVGWSIPMSWQHVLNVGGLRGSIPIALALGLPEGMEHRGMIVTAVFFSLVVHGLLVKPTLRHLGLIGADAVQYEFELKLVRSIALKAALKEAKRTAEDGHVSASICDKLIEELERERETINREMSRMASGAAAAIPALERTLADPESFVRVWAAAALLAIVSEHDAAWSTLRERLEDPQHFVRSLAAWRLGRLATGSVHLPEIRRDLERQVGDRDPSVRLETTIALRRL